MTRNVLEMHYWFVMLMHQKIIFIQSSSVFNMASVDYGRELRYKWTADSDGLCTLVVEGVDFSRHFAEIFSHICFHLRT